MASVSSNPAGEGGPSDVVGPWNDGMNEHDQLRALVIENKRLHKELGVLDDALTELVRAASCMPDAGLDDSDPRRAWWFNVLAPARDNALKAMGF